MRTSLLAAFVAFSSSGCNSMKCGPGTFQSGDNCVNYDPSDHTPPTTMIMPGSVRSRAAVPDPITLVANESATVYYTIDGTDPDPATTPGHRDMATIRTLPSPSTVKFFSVDTAGNREAVQSAAFEQDLTGPAPVTGMNVTVTGGTAHVTWTNPTDADWAGTTVARVVDVVDAVPVDGTIPSLADQLSPSLQVISTGNATSVDDPGVKPGIVRYVAWSYDDLGNFSTTTTATTNVALGSLDAVLVYDTTQSKLTIQSAPPDIDLSMTTAGASGGTLTVSLIAINKSNTYLINPKVEVTSATNGTFSNSDGTADTFPYKDIGPNAFAPTSMVATSMTFTTSGTTITVNLRFAHHPAMVATHGYRYYAGVQLIDTGTGTPGTVFSLISPGPAGYAGGVGRTPAVVAGHFLDVPTTHGVIERFDLATGMAAGIATVGEGTSGNLQGLLAIEGGELAFIKVGSKGRARYGEVRDGKVQIVRLDEGMHVLKTNTYAFTDTTGACQPALSPDGSTIALAAGTSLALIDAHTLDQIDADPATPTLDTFTLTSTGRVGTIVWLNNTDLLMVTRKVGEAVVLKRTGNTYTTSVVYNDLTTYQGGFGAAVATDGKVWMSFPAGVKVYDPATGLTAPLAATYTPTPATGMTTHGVVRSGNDMWILHGDNMGADRVANDGTILQSISLPVITNYGYTCSPTCNGIYGHWLQLTQ